MRPNLFKLKSWATHEKRVLEVFEGALSRLERDETVAAREDDINRRLLFHARRENYRLIRRGRGCKSNIYAECTNQPAMDDFERAARESKIPDFTCGLVDAQVGVDQFLVLECKRLGTAPTPSWVLNTNYVKNGMRRFVDKSWAYGKGAPSGAMIGYVQSMDVDRIRDEVNKSSMDDNLPALMPIRSTDKQQIIRHLQELDRPFAGTPFRLRHIWVDLRPRYLRGRVHSRVA